jgi:hypothetical protein
MLGEMNELPQFGVVAVVLLAAQLTCCGSLTDPQPMGTGSDMSTAIDGTYSVRWRTEGDVAGKLTMSEGIYRYEGQPAPYSGQQFHFVANPRGRYTVKLAAGVSGIQPKSLSNNDVIATVNFDPDMMTFESTDGRKVILVRWCADRQTLYFHSVVSELELWRIERSMADR